MIKAGLHASNQKQLNKRWDHYRSNRSSPTNHPVLQQEERERSLNKPRRKQRTRLLVSLPQWMNSCRSGAASSFLAALLLMNKRSNFLCTTALAQRIMLMILVGNRLFSVIKGRPCRYELLLAELIYWWTLWWMRLITFLIDHRQMSFLPCWSEEDWPRHFDPSIKSHGERNQTTRICLLTDQHHWVDSIRRRLLHCSVESSRASVTFCFSALELLRSH